MAELGVKETRELLVGTWIGVALIVEVLIARYDLPREEVLLLLADAETAAKGERCTAIAGMRALIDRLG